MKNTIEKALERQRAEQQAQERAAPVSDPVASELVDGEPVTEESRINEPEVNNPKGNGSAANSSAPGYLDLDFALLESKGFVGVGKNRSQVNEEYREIKRKLLSNAFGPLASTLKNSNIIMVSSARPSEGKTFTAINLALSIAAEKDKTVLLVDADVLKPNVLRSFEQHDREGLMEYLMNPEADVSEAMYNTPLENLRVIPAGQTHHLSTELLSSQKMIKTIDEFANRYKDRVVIVDTPPLLGINETAIMTHFAGQGVVVIEEGATPVAAVKRAVAMLHHDMAVGFVMNKSLRKPDVGYYGYGYYGTRS